MDDSPGRIEPCPYQSNILRPRIYNANLRSWEFPNRCMSCVSDAGNLNCSVYNEYIENLAKEIPVITMVPEPMTEEYRKAINA